MNIPLHFESVIGPITQGWAWPDFPGFSAALFKEKPNFGEQTIATIGFSHNVLSVSRDRKVRLEFVLVVDHLYDPRPLAAKLMRFALSFLTMGQAPLQGDVFGPGQDLVPHTGKNFLYCTSPGIFPDALGMISGTDPDTIVVWVIPISAREAHFRQKVGWREFENRLVDQNPSLANLARPDIDLVASG